jgi:hypothetical protein
VISSPFLPLFARQFAAEILFNSLLPSIFFRLLNSTAVFPSHLFDVCHRFLLIFNQRMAKKVRHKLMQFMLFLCWFFSLCLLFFLSSRLSPLLHFRSVQIAQSNIMLLSSIIDYLISGKMQIIMP